MQGLYVAEGILYFNGEVISSNMGEIGLHVREGRQLFYNNQLLALGDGEGVRTGLHIKNDILMFDNTVVGSGEVIDPEIDPEIPPDEANPMYPIMPVKEFTDEGYWVPPLQQANVASKTWSTQTIIDKYDALCALDNKLEKHRYENSSGEPILSTAGGYELYSYVFTPTTYDKTFFFQACIHGDEKNSRFILYRMMEILIKDRDKQGYRGWREVYDRCRIVIIPVANPWGNDNVRWVPYPDAKFGLNLNRNFEVNFNEFLINSISYGGPYPFFAPETRHTRDVVLKYGVENIDMAFDIHDGHNVSQHYWMNYNVDCPLRQPIDNFVKYMLLKHGVALEDAIIPNSRDVNNDGACGDYLTRTLGLSGGTNEWMGGLGGDFGYDFGAENITHSLEVRANMLFMGLQYDVKQWKVNEPVGSPYLHIDYARAFSRQGLRREWSIADSKVPDDMIFARWDALTIKHPTKLVKSAVLGVNATGQDIHSYTYGDGAKKALFVGGVMRLQAPNKINEYGMYELIEYLFNTHMTDQSPLLRELRDNYTIIILPLIDSNSVYLGAPHTTGLNNEVLSAPRWVIDTVTQKAKPASGESGEGNHGVKIIKKLIDDNTDLKCIVSGGEIMEFYPGNSQTDYTTDYQVQFVLAKNQPNLITDYASHLTTTRGELVDVVNSQGRTFGDYAYDNHAIPTYFVQQKVSSRYVELADSMTMTQDEYLHSNYEAGRRIANIANLFLIHS